MKRVFITGASGFLGRYLVKFAPPHIRVLAQYRSQPLQGVPEKVQTIQLDWLKPDWSAMERFGPEVILHTAAHSSIDACELNPELAWKINFESTKGLVDFARASQARFIFVSTDVVFDGQQGNYREEDSPRPINVYAETKVAAEQYILQNLPDGVVVRPALFYGISLDGRPSFTELMLKKLRAGKKVFLYTDQIRTPVLVNNLARALWELVDLDFRGILHIGGSQKVSRYEMGQIVCQLFHLPEKLMVPIPSAESRQVAPRPLDCSLNLARAKRILRTQLIGCRAGLFMAFQ